MSERYKSKITYNSPYGPIELTCHFKFEHASLEQKFGKEAGNGQPVCNGCGPSGYGDLVPDSILGVCVTICGHIHNWGYAWGADHEDKMVADETFGDNMDRIIRAAYLSECKLAKEAHETFLWKLAGGSLIAIRTWWENRNYAIILLKIKKLYEARLAIAEDAYESAVRVFGKSAFWDKRKINFTLDEVHS